MKNQVFEFTHVVLNITFFRFYHFLQNCVDFAYIASLILYMYIRIQSSLFIDSTTYLHHFFLLTLFSHFLYSITYIINDYINYEEDLAIKMIDVDKYSFYKYRPIHYFGKRITGILVFVYATYVFILWRFMFVRILAIHEIILIVLLFSCLSLFASLSKRKSFGKKCTFLLQLYSKYFVLAILLTRSLGISISLYEILCIGLCISPYTLYRTFQDLLSYFFLEHRMKENRCKGLNYAAICILIAIISVTLIIVVLNFSLIMVHFLVSAPFATLVIVLPSLIFGRQDKTIYDLYKRSSVKLAFALLLLYMVLWL